MLTDIETLTENLRQEYIYNFTTGSLKRISTGKYIHTDIVVLNNKKYNRKLISWLIYYGVKPDGVIIHRNLNQEDYSLHNLKVLTKKEYSKYIRLLNNANKYIFLRESKRDVYDVYIEWLDFDTGKKVKEKFNDHTVARRFIRSLLRELLRELENLGVDVTEADIFVSKPRL
jgi:hypothetical protein